MEGEEAVCPFRRIPDDILLEILSSIQDIRCLAHCASVCKLWHRKAREVETATLICPGNFKTYWDKVMDIVDKLQGFPRLKKVRVCIGTNGMGGSGSAGRRDNSEAWTKCMRYAEIGASVDKFLFLAAKSGSADVFYSSIGGGGGETADGAQRGGMQGGPRRGESGQHRSGSATEREASFADGFGALPLLQQLLLVDVTDNVTIHMRPHHMAQLRRANQRTFGGSLGLESLGSEGLEAFGDEEFRPELLGAGAAAYTASLAAPSAATAAANTSSLAPSAAPSPTDASLPPPHSSPLPAPAATPPPAPPPPASAPHAAAPTAVAPPAAPAPARTAEQALVLETTVPPAELSRRDLSCHPDSPNFHVSFWRTDRVRVAYPLPRQQQELTDMSVCVATQDSVALEDADVAELARSAVGGPVLAATVAFLNSQSSMHAL
ncbi:unnamed protein product [Closterium sp. Yama58-4]|nr:unnamed protein product [Closterium sp. Yama58-4]